MRVIIKEPNKDAYATDIPNTLDEFQKIVGGYIEVIPFGMDYLLVLNEEGKLEGLEPNLNLRSDIIVGTVILVKENGEDFGAIETDKEKWMIQALNKLSI